MPHDRREIVFPQKKYYTLERPHFISLYGVRKFWEVTPIVGIVTFVVTSASLYFTLYYPWTRTDVAYTNVPICRKIELNNPKHCKFIDFVDYATYKYNDQLLQVTNLMNCEEWQRFCGMKKKRIDIEWYLERLLPFTEYDCHEIKK